VGTDLSLAAARGCHIEVTVPEDVAERVRLPIERMVAIS
jgi:quinolinate synthase